MYFYLGILNQGGKMRKTIIIFFSLMFLIFSGFLFSQSFTLISPNGGESWCIGKTYEIKWNSSQVQGNIILKLQKGNTLLGSIAWNIPNTGTHSWTINDIQGAPIEPGNDYKVIVRSKDDISIEDISDSYFEIKNCINFDKDLSDVPDYTRRPLSKPDLEVDYVKVITKEYGNIDIEVKIRNTGDKIAGSNKGALTIHKKYSQGFILNKQNIPIPKIGPNASYYYTYSTKIIDAGRYVVIFKVDTMGEIDEVKEEPNSGAKFITLMPDLTVYMRQIPSVNVGVRRSITGVIKNIGTAKAPPVSVKFHVDGAFTKYYTTTELEPGRGYTIGKKPRWWTKGTRDIYMIVDHDHKVTEIYENNNKVERKVTVTLATEFSPHGAMAPPDLVPKIETRKRIGVNQKCLVKIIVENKGSKYAGEFTELRFKVGDKRTKSYNVSPLFPDEKFTITEEIKFSEPGQQQLVVTVDALNIVDEGSGENNNTVTKVITVVE